MRGATGVPLALRGPRTASVLALCLGVLVAACRPGTAEPYRPELAQAAQATSSPGLVASPNAPDGPKPSATPAVEGTPTPRCKLEADDGHILSVHNDLYVRDGNPRSVTTIAAALEGVWVGFGDPSSEAGGGVWRHDGQAWITFTQAAGLPVSDNVRVLRVAPDGSVWAGAGPQVARFADDTWEKMADRDVLKGPVLDIAFTPDGATWVASALELSCFDGQTWTPAVPSPAPQPV